MNPDLFHDYAEYRQRGEDKLCTRLRLGLGEDEGRRYEAAYQRCQEGRKAA